MGYTFQQIKGVGGMSAGKVILKAAFPMAGVIWDIVESSGTKVDNASSGAMSELELEAARQSVRLKMAKLQAQVAQEMAIASRIESAEVVEIEEFYDSAGKGNLGAEYNAATMTGSLGLGGEGRVVTKRVYHFKGWRQDVAVEVGKIAPV